LLVDRFNVLVKERQNVDLDNILLEVVGSRIKPIFLTTLTTILGLLTLAIKDELW
jgi:multidrug efflux pump subunit AcrB